MAAVADDVASGLGAMSLTSFDEKELLEQGFVVIEKAVTEDKIRKLLYETPLKSRSSIRKILSTRKVPEGMVAVPRSKGRLDLQLPDSIPCLLEGTGILEQLHNLLNKDLKGQVPPPLKTQIRTRNILYTAPGAVDQPWHTDGGDDEKTGSYYTVIVSLTKSTPKLGTIELQPFSHTDPESEEPAIAMKLDCGDVIIFDGQINHRGTTNPSQKKRFTWYAVLSQQNDLNVF